MQLENKSSHSFTIQPEDRLAINFISKDIERYTGAYTASKKINQCCPEIYAK